MPGIVRPDEREGGVRYRVADGPMNARADADGQARRGSGVPGPCDNVDSVDGFDGRGARRGGLTPMARVVVARHRSRWPHSGRRGIDGNDEKSTEDPRRERHGTIVRAQVLTSKFSVLSS